MKRKPELSGMNGGECIFSTGEEKRRREENGEKTDKVKVAGGKLFPACGLYEWIFCLGCLFAILEKYQMVDISFPCAITKTQKITFYYVEKNEGMLRSSQIMIKFAAICNVEFAK